jgi:hypothetical protein
MPFSRVEPVNKKQGRAFSDASSRVGEQRAGRKGNFFLIDVIFPLSPSWQKGDFFCHFSF